MQTRTITVDYARPRGYDVGYRAENNFTLLALPVPAELEGADSYRVYFESTVGEYLQTELLTPADGYVTVKITSDIVPEPGNMAAQLVAFADGEIVGYAPMITGSAKVSIPDGTERLSHSLAAEIALNTAARHSHENKAVLDKFAESDGKLQYDGKAVESNGNNDFIINLTLVVGDDDFTATSDVSKTDIDAAYTAGKNLIVHVALSTVVYTLPLFSVLQNQGDNTTTFIFGATFGGQTMYAELNTDWVINISNVGAYDIGYENAALQGVDNVKGALDAIVETQQTHDDDILALGEAVDKLDKKAHTHSNKTVLDLLSAADGKLQYNGSDVGLKGDKGADGTNGKDGTDGKTPVKGTDYWTAADKAEIVADTLAALPTWTGGNY